MTLKALLRVRLLGFIKTLTGATRSKKKKSPLQLVGFGLLMLYSYGFFGFYFWHVFEVLAPAFQALRLGWLYFAFVALLGFGLMLVGSTFVAKTQLFEAKDNDLLMSMPIPPGQILLSRMLMLWLINMLMMLVVSVPGFVIWLRSGAADGWMLGSYMLLFWLLLPLLALMVSALFGWLLHRISARMRSKSLVTVLFSLVFMGAYFYLVSGLNVWLERLAEDPGALASSLGRAAPLAWIGRAVADHDAPALAGLSLGIAAVFVLGWLALSAGFIRASTDRGSVAKRVYREKSVEALSLRRALLQREWRHFAACPAYILNGALGALVMPVAAVALYLKGGALIAELSELSGAQESLPWIVMLGTCFMISTTQLTAPSISLEGKSLWLLQSLPVAPREVLRAKLRLHLLITLPGVLLMALAAVLVFRPEPMMGAALFAIPTAFTVFMALLGLFENLRHPHLDWINETQAVKSGASVMLSVLISYGLIILAGLLFGFLGAVIGRQVLALGVLALLALLIGLLWRWLRTRGERLFAEL